MAEQLADSGVGTVSRVACVVFIVGEKRVVYSDVCVWIIALVDG